MSDAFEKWREREIEKLERSEKTPANCIKLQRLLLNPTKTWQLFKQENPNLLIHIVDVTK